MAVDDPTSDTPGGDLTDHGADPADRDEDQRDDRAGGSASEQVPGGGLTDHGVDPESRGKDTAAGDTAAGDTAAGDTAAGDTADGGSTGGSSSEETPGGGLTDHGVDPSER